MKKISIIIPLYNLEGLIGKCIASALAIRTCRPKSTK